MRRSADGDVAAVRDLPRRPGCHCRLLHPGPPLQRGEAPAPRSGGPRLDEAGHRAGRGGPEVSSWRSCRAPAAGVELVLEVDDVTGERDQVVAAGWPLETDLRKRPSA